MKKNPLPLPVQQYHIAPQSGTAFTIKKGQIIRVIDVEGGASLRVILFCRKGKERMFVFRTDNGLQRITTET